MIVYPDWYEGGYPDRELVTLDLLQRFLDLLTPQGLAVTRLPDDLEQLLAAGRVVAHVYRGGLGEDGLYDAAAVQIGVLAATRADSWEALEYLRQMVLSYRRGGPVRRADGSITEIASTGEMVGPQQLDDFNPDNRLVPATFLIECRRPRNLPDYAAIRESLPL